MIIWQFISYVRARIYLSLSDLAVMVIRPLCYAYSSYDVIGLRPRSLRPRIVEKVVEMLDTPPQSFWTFIWLTGYFMINAPHLNDIERGG